MNKVVESFVQQSGPYWGDNTSYRFLCNVDGGIADATEMPTGGERIIKSNFTVSLKGYLLPEYIVNIINRKRANTNKQITDELEHNSRLENELNTVNDKLKN